MSLSKIFDPDLKGVYLGLKGTYHGWTKVLVRD